MPGKKKSAKKKSAKKKAVRRMGGGMMGPKKKMARGGPVKKMGGGMMGPKKKRAGGGMMGPKKKRAGGGMMGPKKKMAKGGLTSKRKPGGRMTVDDVKRAMPTGRSAAAKKVAMKGVKTKGGTLLAKLKQGKGNPAGKDLSRLGSIKALLGSGLGSKKPRPKSMDMAPQPKRPKKMPGLRDLMKLKRQKKK